MQQQWRHWHMIAACISAVIMYYYRLRCPALPGPPPQRHRPSSPLPTDASCRRSQGRGHAAVSHLLTFALPLILSMCRLTLLASSAEMRRHRCRPPRRKDSRVGAADTGRAVPHAGEPHFPSAQPQGTTLLRDVPLHLRSRHFVLYPGRGCRRGSLSVTPPDTPALPSNPLSQSHAQFLSCQSLVLCGRTRRRQHCRARRQ